MVLNIIQPKIEGFVKIADITDPDNHQLLVDKKNQIHFENMSIALAKSLAHRPDGHLHEMHFGNGASTVSGIGTISYLPPNIEGQNSDLYNPTFFKVIDDQSPLNNVPDSNNIAVRHSNNNLFSDIIVTSTLDFGEPVGQEAFDTATSTEQQFIFDELGLRTFAGSPGAGILVSHVIFSPVQKSLNRQLEIIYTIRISMV